jgi:hypothetical protein
MDDGRKRKQTLNQQPMKNYQRKKGMTKIKIKEMNE